MKAAPLNTGRDNGSFSIISLTECQEALSERQFGKQTRDTYFVLISTRIGDFTDFFRDISLDNET